MQKNTLSVIVPVYNVAEYIETCLESIMHQSYKELDIIVVDDGSVDDSGKKIDAIALRDSRIKVIHKENEGLLKARLTGALHAKGEYVTFVDGDDWIAKDMYRDLMCITGKMNVDIVMSGIYRYMSEENIIEDTPHLRTGLYNKPQIQDQIWPVMLWSSKCDGWEVDPSLCTKLFRREDIIKQLQEVSSLNVYYAEDTVTIFPLLLKVKSIYISENCYYYHRQKTDGEVASYIKSPDFINKTYSVYKYLEQMFQETGVWELFEKQLNFFFMNSVQLKKKCYSDVIEKKEDIFPFFEIPRGKKVILYGAGNVGKKFMLQNKNYHFADVVMWVDKNYQVLDKELRVCSPEQISDIEYDNLLIAVQSATMASEIRDELVRQGVNSEKIIWVGVQKQIFRR